MACRLPACRAVVRVSVAVVRLPKNRAEAQFPFSKVSTLEGVVSTGKSLCDLIRTWQCGETHQRRRNGRQHSASPCDGGVSGARSWRGPCGGATRWDTRHRCWRPHWPLPSVGRHLNERTRLTRRSRRTVAICMGVSIALAVILRPTVPDAGAGQPQISLGYPARFERQYPNLG